MRASNPYIIALPVFFFLFSLPVFALDENSPSLKFLPADSQKVIAFDMSEFMSYCTSVGKGMQEADRAHFLEGLEALSFVLEKKEGRPDVLTFFENLSGVQAFAIFPEKKIPLMVFSASSADKAEILRNYTLAYILENRYKKSLGIIETALKNYYYRVEKDPETGEDRFPLSYPESLAVLLEAGYLESLPLNPYTGKPIEVMNFDSAGSLGNIAYKPCNLQRCCKASCDADKAPISEDEGTPVHQSFILKSWHIGGVQEQGPWSRSYKSYSNLKDKLDILNKRGWDSMGFHINKKSGWTYFTRDDASYALASGGKYLLAGASVEELMAAVQRSKEGKGFKFSTPTDFNTKGAFYRYESDLSSLKEQLMALIKEKPLPQPFIKEMIDSAIENAGFEALSREYGAMWFQGGDIRMVKRLMLSGKSKDSLIGSIVYSKPIPLMTVSDKSLSIICQLAWANPGDNFQAVFNFFLESIIPAISAQMGMQGFDPGFLVGMLGLGENKISSFADEVYILATSSEERAEGLWLPGVTAVIKTSNNDLPLVMTGVMDSLSFVFPDLPLKLHDFGDENARTWIFTDEKVPLSPTIAWTDGWVVKSLWREDAIRARDALKKGTLLSPDSLAPANIRLRCNRQNLMRGIADIIFVMPCYGVPAAGSIFELAAQLSGKNERLFSEATNKGDFVEYQCDFSLGLFERLVPVMSYLMKSSESF